MLLTGTLVSAGTGSTSSQTWPATSTTLGNSSRREYNLAFVSETALKKGIRNGKKIISTFGNYNTIRMYQTDADGREMTSLPKTVVLLVGDLFGTVLLGCSYDEREITEYKYVKRVTAMQGMAFNKLVHEEDGEEEATDESEADAGIDTDENDSETDTEPNCVENFK